MLPQCPHPGGWTTAEAAARLAADGPNELPAAPAGLLAPAGRNRAADPDAVPGVGRLGREQVLARSIPAIELLRATTVSCVDKTGTLISNRMRLCRLWSEGAAYACGQSPASVRLHGSGHRRGRVLAAGCAGRARVAAAVCLCHSRARAVAAVLPGGAATLVWCAVLRRILASLSSGPR